MLVQQIVCVGVCVKGRLVELLPFSNYVELIMDRSDLEHGSYYKVEEKCVDISTLKAFSQYVALFFHIQDIEFFQCFG